MLFDKRTIINSPIESVFNLVADIANAPNIHPMIIKRERLDDREALDSGAEFRYYYSFFGRLMHFDFTISEFIPNQKVVYTGTPFFGIIPRFMVLFNELEEGTEIHYVMNPAIPGWMSLFAKPVMVQAGNRDLEAYFDKVRTMLEQHTIISANA